MKRGRLLFLFLFRFFFVLFLGSLFINRLLFLCRLPRISWSLDPFGQTPTAMSLFKQMGFEAAVIDRIPYSEKQKLVQHHSIHKTASKHTSHLRCYHNPRCLNSGLSSS